MVYQFIFGTQPPPARLSIGSVRSNPISPRNRENSSFVGLPISSQNWHSPRSSGWESDNLRYRRNGMRTGEEFLGTLSGRSFDPQAQGGRRKYGSRSEVKKKSEESDVRPESKASKRKYKNRRKTRRNKENRPTANGARQPPGGPLPFAPYGFAIGVGGDSPPHVIDSLVSPATQMVAFPRDGQKPRAGADPLQKVTKSRVDTGEGRKPIVTKAKLSQAIKKLRVLPSVHAALTTASTARPDMPQASRLTDDHSNEATMASPRRLSDDHADEATMASPRRLSDDHAECELSAPTAGTSTQFPSSARTDALAQIMGCELSAPTAGTSTQFPSSEAMPQAPRLTDAHAELSAPTVRTSTQFPSSADGDAMAQILGQWKQKFQREAMPQAPRLTDDHAEAPASPASGEGGNEVSREGTENSSGNSDG